jgi:single-stranded DNA-specific DHH superfamily exonuclease
VATNIVRQYNKPTFLWGGADAEEGEEIRIFKGSCRSPEGVDVVKMMRAVPEGFFLNAGGHSATGGYSIDIDHIHSFEEVMLSAFDQVYGTSILTTKLDAGTSSTFNSESDSTTEDVSQEILVDKLLDPSEVSGVLWSDIEKLSPYGEAHSKPLFLLQDIIISEQKMFGKNKEHIEVALQNPLTGKETRAIKFFAADDESLIKKLQIGQIASVVAHMEKSMFKRYPEYRLRIVDIL